MSTPLSPFNPARQVERIREILVGRQLAAVEHRLDRIEHRVTSQPANGRPFAPPAPEPSMPPPTPDARPAPDATVVTALEGRIDAEAGERRKEVAALAAKIHASLDQLDRRVNACPPATEVDQRFGALREELRLDQARLEAELRQEARRRAGELGRLEAGLARLAAAGDGAPAAAAVAELRAVVDAWQRRLLEGLQGREQWLIGQLRAELARLRSETWHWLGELHRSKVGWGDLDARLARVAPHPAPAASSESPTGRPPPPPASTVF